MDSQETARDFVTVSVPGLIIIHVAERVKFDTIELQVYDHGIQPWGHRLVTKRIEHGSSVVVFLHWLALDDNGAAADVTDAQLVSEALQG
jgi:hypothetical protein